MVAERETIGLRELRAYAAAARRLNLTAAAADLGVPKSTVSKAVAHLERRLGVRLLERTSRRVALTGAGSLLLARAESLLAEADQLARDMHEETHRPSGTVRLAAPPELGTLLAAGFVAPVLAAHPRLAITLRVDYAFEDLMAPEVDVAFRVGSIHDDRLVARTLGVFRRELVASAAYLAGRRLRAPADLGRCNCLTLGAAATAATWTLEPRAARAGSREPVEVAVHGNFAARSFTALLEAARAGLGVARVPDFLAHPAIARGEVQAVLPAWGAPASAVFLVHRFGHERVRRVEVVIEEARARIPALLAAGAVAAAVSRRGAPR